MTDMGYNGDKVLSPCQAAPVFHLSQARTARTCL
jgi:hypothetical protein